MIMFGTILLIRDPVKHGLRGKPISAMIVSLLFILFITVFNSYLENTCDINFIISFLTLKIVSNHALTSFVSFGLTVGYLVFYFAFLQLLINIGLNRTKNNNR